ncbi:hypothetical protein JCM10212_000386 [Sporobolomyces blumeae]
MPDRDKKSYPRCAAKPSDASYSFRPSSPILAPSPSSHSFFSRSLQSHHPHSSGSSKGSPKQTVDGPARIPWDPSPASAAPAASRPHSPPPAVLIARPASPVSVVSYESSVSSSNPTARDRARSHTRSEFGWKPAEGASEDDDVEDATHGKKGSGKRDAVKRRMFGISKKGSSFSLRGIAKSVVSFGLPTPTHDGAFSLRSPSFDHALPSPPSSPTLSLSPPHPPPLHRQQSAPTSNQLSPKRPELPRTTPSSPILPLPFPVRDRKTSAPVYFESRDSTERNHLKAAKFLGEDVIPRGKAARLLGVERKKTLPKSPRTTHTSSESDSDRPNRHGFTAKEFVSFFDSFDSPPRSTASLASSPPSIQSSPRSREALSLSVSSPSPSRHRHTESASDPFWHSYSAAPILTTQSLEVLPSVSEVDSPVLTLASSQLPSPELPRPGSRFRREIEEDSDPVDSVYMGRSRDHSSLNSFSINLRHVSTSSSMTHIFSSRRGDSSGASTRPQSSRVSQRSSRRSSWDDLISASRQPSPSISRLVVHPTLVSPQTLSRGSDSKPPSPGSLRHRASLPNLAGPAPTSPLLPLPSPLSPASVDSPTSASTTSSSFLSFVSPEPPPSSAPSGPLPPLPSPRFDAPLVPDPSASTAIFRPVPTRNPKRSNTLASVASSGTRQRQYRHALEALEGRRAGLSARPNDEGDGAMEGDVREEERGGRKRAARARKMNRERRARREVERDRVQASEPGEDEDERRARGIGRRRSLPFLELEGDESSEGGVDADRTEEAGGGEGETTQVQPRPSQHGVASLEDETSWRPRPSLVDPRVLHGCDPARLATDRDIEHLEPDSPVVPTRDLPPTLEKPDRSFESSRDIHGPPRFSMQLPYPDRSSLAFPTSVQFLHPIPRSPFVEPEVHRRRTSSLASVGSDDGAIFSGMTTFSGFPVDVTADLFPKPPGV